MRAHRVTRAGFAVGKTGVESPSGQPDSADKPLKEVEMTAILLFILGGLMAIAGDQLGDALGHLWYVGGYLPCLLLWAIAIKVDTDSRYPEG